MTRGQGTMPGRIAGVLMVMLMLMLLPAGLAAAASGAAGTPVVRGDRLGSTDDEGRSDVFAPGPGQEYELAFFIAAAVLTLLVAGGFVVVIIVHGRGSHASDREASPDEIEA